MCLCVEHVVVLLWADTYIEISKLYSNNVDMHAIRGMCVYAGKYDESRICWIGNTSLQRGSKDSKLQICQQSTL